MRILLNSIIALKKDIEKNSPDLLPLLKAIAHEKRLDLMISMIQERKSFQSLLEFSRLQKTALAYHLQVLIEAKLIHKPDYGYYELLPDGKHFLKIINHAWTESLQAQEKRLHEDQQLGLSPQFLSNFFHK